jgi:hypothetical protein
MTPTEAVVRVAASLLPRRSRDRYREQWLADLRDAPAAGIRASDIAIGSLAFAVSAARPLPSPAGASPATVDRRSRLAVGLALAAAVVALTRYADLVSVAGSSGTPTIDSALAAASLALAAFTVGAPVVALTLVTVTRRVPGAVRIAVILLASASIAPLVQTSVDVGGGYGSIFFSRGALAYPVALGVVVAASFSAARGMRNDRSTRAAEGSGASAFFAAGGVVVVLAAAWALSALVAIWAARTPQEFGGDPAGRANWETLGAQSEQTVVTVFVGFAVVMLAVGAAIAVVAGSGRATARSSIAATVAGLSLVAVGYAGVAGFLGIMAANTAPTPLVDAVMLLGRWGLVAVSLVAVGGLGRSRQAAAAAAASSPATLAG